MENNAWFWLMGSNCPLQNDQPFGGKFQLMILISPRNGSDILHLLVISIRKSLLASSCWLLSRESKNWSPDVQFWLGKIPNNDRIKLITRNGFMLSCGCEPPVDPMALGSIPMLGAVLAYRLPAVELAHTPFCGV